MKKLSLIIFGAFCWSATAGLALAGSFPDVPEDHLHYQAVEYLDDHGVINGYSDGTFKPDGLVNRAEAMKMITLATGASTEGAYEVLFPDVLKDQWFFKYVMSAQKAGIVTGYSNGKFKPEATVNFAETMKMLLLSAHFELPIEGSDVFSDVKAGDWFSPYFVYGRNMNLVMSDDYGFVYPDQKMTRANFAEVVYRVMVVKENQGKPFPLHLNWPYYESSSLPFKMKYDPTWQVSEAGGEVVFLRANKEFGQSSAARLYPNSAIVRVNVDENEGGKSASQYFSNLKGAFPEATPKEFTFAGRPALEIVVSDARIVDWYVYLADGRVLGVYTQYGVGALGYQLQQLTKAMLSTLAYRELPPLVDNYEEILSGVLENVLIEGKGMVALGTLPDKLIIETDSIGVGTGPVDYYYSEGVNYTFKYERASDVILASRSGKTTSF